MRRRPIVSGDRVFLSTAYNTGAVLLEVKKGKLEDVWEGEEILDATTTRRVLVKDHLYGIDGRQERRAGAAAVRRVGHGQGAVDQGRVRVCRR